MDNDAKTNNVQSIISGSDNELNRAKDTLNKITVKRLDFDYVLTSADKTDLSKYDRYIDKYTAKGVYAGVEIIKTLSRVYQILYNIIIRDTNRIKSDLVEKVKNIEANDIETVKKLTDICLLITNITEFYNYGDIAKLLQDSKFFIDNNEDKYKNIIENISKETLRDKSEYFKYLFKAKKNPEYNTIISENELDDLVNKITNEIVDIRKYKLSKDEVESVISKKLKTIYNIEYKKNTVTETTKSKPDKNEKLLVENAVDDMVRKEIDQIIDSKRERRSLLYLYVAFMFNILLLNVCAVLVLKLVGITFPYDLIMALGNLAGWLVYSFGSVLVSIISGFRITSAKQNVPPDVSTMLIKTMFSLI